MKHERIPPQEFNIDPLPDDRIPHVKNALLTESPPSEETHTEFNEWFDPSQITTHELVKKARYAEVYRCETEHGQPVYYHDAKPDRFTVASKIKTRKIGYYLARAYNLPTVPFAFGNTWAASPEFPTNTSVKDITFSDTLVNELLTDFAKHILILNWDINRDYLINKNETRMHIDITPRLHSSITVPDRMRAECLGNFSIHHEYPPEIVDLITERAADMARYVTYNFSDFIDQESFPTDQYIEYQNELAFLTSILPITMKQQSSNPRPDYNAQRHGFAGNGHLENWDSPWQSFNNLYKEK